MADDLNAAVQQRLVHTHRIVIKGAAMEPGVSKEDRASTATASASTEEKPAAVPSTDYLYIDAPWNRKATAAVAAAAVSGDRYTPKPNFQPNTKAALWNQKDYFHASRLMDIQRPPRCAPLSTNMPAQCPAYPYSTQPSYHWQELSRAMNKALRHDR